MSTPKRVHSGVPSGGQFAATNRDESDISLAAPAAPLAPVVKRSSDGYPFVVAEGPLPDEGIFSAPDGAINDFDPIAREEMLDNLSTPRREQGEAFVGTKYAGGHQPASDIGKSLRADIKHAQLAGALPRSARFSVTSSAYSGGQSVRVEVQDLPDRDTRVINWKGGYVTERLSEAGEELQKTVRSMLNAYQRDNSDIQSDYFDVQFYGDVTIQSEHGRDYDEMEKFTRSASRAAKAGGDIADLRSSIIEQREILARRGDARQGASKRAQAAVERLMD
ncbi:MAG: hypothetical protein M3Y35_04740 [Actinomycetota bacterium]|nr:hypothetical protein [Actinomycetota bacterium]